MDWAGAKKGKPLMGAAEIGAIINRSEGEAVCFWCNLAQIGNPSCCFNQRHDMPLCGQNRPRLRQLLAVFAFWQDDAAQGELGAERDILGMVRGRGGIDANENGDARACKVAGLACQFIAREGSVFRGDGVFQVDDDGIMRGGNRLCHAFGLVGRHEKREIVTKRGVRHAGASIRSVPVKVVTPSGLRTQTS